MFLVMLYHSGMLFFYEHTYPTISFCTVFSNNFFFITGRYIVKETAPPLSSSEIKTNIFATLVWLLFDIYNPYLATESICPRK